MENKKGKLGGTNTLNRAPPLLRRTHLAAAAAGQLLDVSDVVPGVAVERLLEAELIQVVADEADGAAQDEEAVEAAEGHQVVALLPREGAARPDHVNERHGDATVHVQDEVRALAGRELLNLQGEVQHRGGLEVLLGIVLDEFHALVRVGQGLDAVANAHDELVRLLHILDEVLGANAAVEGLAEHLRGIVQGATEAGADCQQATAEGGDQVLARARGHDGVVRAADRGSVVGSDHEDHLDELRAGRGQLAAEPQQGQHASDAHLLREDVGDGDAAVGELLAAVVRDGRDEVGGLADHAQLLGPRVVHRHLGRLTLMLLDDDALLDELNVDLADHLGQLVERVRHVEARVLHGLVLRSGGFLVAAGLRTRVAELHLCGEAGGAGADTPGDDGLRDAAALDRVDEVVFVHAADLAQQEQHLGARVVLVAQEVVQEAAARVAVAPDRNSLEDTIGVAAHDVVELVGHAARF
mmetsp:Transcript_117758/g.377784  ORF Transcript_117758/g.377784 Transcript_117758/m.377784 type:complete len:469 (-) Transcript_117758:1060-2466(-)